MDRIISYLGSIKPGNGVKMKVSFHATMRDIAGVDEIADVTAADVIGLLRCLEDRLGSRLIDAILTEGRLREDIVILVNGQNISHTGGLKTSLNVGDDVAIFPPVSGG